MAPVEASTTPIVGAVTVWPIPENDETPPPDPATLDWYMKLVNE